MGKKITVQLTISGTIEIPQRGMAPASEEYGKSVKERRKKKRLTAAKLSQLSGVSVSHIYRIEDGTRSPGGLIVAKLEQVLGDG